MTARVSIDPEVSGGKLTVTGTHVSVEDVLGCLDYAARLAGHRVTFHPCAPDA
ncbi:hypothetical protein DAERI_110126 [Deinococcus aerius]|uniref:Uncharacterized protein n=1 Tax=Deinococcus aerius TaxID=200253 RepID=A0A2I9CXV8_9DEIO|nr:DUF433 domain-containing protein [Deinococcus aerius]GBF06944.1 hypothetical protein DAERI_110126 [Deinococcus aerius]